MEILISFLGNTKYTEVYYYMEDDNKKRYYTKYVQEAIIEMNNIDLFLILLTKESKKENWENDGLYEIIKNRVKIKEIVEENISDKYSMYRIFSNIVGKIKNIIEENKNDEITIHLDITNSFRFIPIVGFASLQYFDYLFSNVKIGKVFYGAMEQTGKTGMELSMISQKEREEYPVPIRDVSKLFNMVKLTKGIWEWEELGTSKTFDDFYKGKELLKSQKIFKDMEDILIRTEGDEIYSGERFIEIREQIEDKNLFGDKNPLENIWKDIRKELLDFLSSFRRESIKNFFIAAEFLYKREQIHQALILLREGLIYELYLESNYEDEYKLFSQDYYKKVNLEKWREDLLKDIRTIRNNWMHARIEEEKEEKNYKKQINKILEDIEQRYK